MKGLQHATSAVDYAQNKAIKELQKNSGGYSEDYVAGNKVIGTFNGKELHRYTWFGEMNITTGNTTLLENFECDTIFNVKVCYKTVGPDKICNEGNAHIIQDPYGNISLSSPDTTRTTLVFYSFDYTI